MLNLDKTTLTAIAMMDRVKDANGDTLNAIASLADALVTNKAAAKDANDAKADNGSTIWNGVLTIVGAVTADEAAADLDATQLGQVLSAVIQNALSGEAVKTVKAYLSTGKKVVAAIKTGKNNLHQFQTKLEGEGEQAKEVVVSYEETRDILKSSEQKTLDKLSKEIMGMVGKLRGRENDARPATLREKDLQSILAFLSPMVTAVDALADAAKTKSKAAKAASELIQQQPTTAGAVEVTRDESLEVQTMQRTGTEG